MTDVLFIALNVTSSTRKAEERRLGGIRWSTNALIGTIFLIVFGVLVAGFLARICLAKENNNASLPSKSTDKIPEESPQSPPAPNSNFFPSNVERPFVIQVV